MKHVKIIKGKKPAANDNFYNFDDEITLAELIQNAASRGLHSVRGGLFGRPATDDVDGDFDCDGREYINAARDTDSEFRAYNMQYPRKANAPKGATCACALGAQLLSPRVDNPLTFTAPDGNDADDGDTLGSDELEYADARSVAIGAAYEQALRPEK